MDFDLSDEDLAFREEFRSWLAEHLVGEYACIRIVDHSTRGHINADDFRFSVDPPQVAPLAEGGGDVSAPVWGFADLHTRVYEETLAGRGFGIGESRASIELSHRIRTTAAAAVAGHLHRNVTELFR